MVVGGAGSVVVGAEVVEVDSGVVVVVTPVS